MLSSIAKWAAPGTQLLGFFLDDITTGFTVLSVLRHFKGDLQKKILKRTSGRPKKTVSGHSFSSPFLHGGIEN